MSTDNDEKRSWRDRGKEVARKATRPVSSAADALTGREVERQVAEYSETFTQVVLGLHEDLTAATRRIAELETALSDLQPSVASASRVATFWVPIVGGGLAVAAIVVSLWALLA